jgi:hypothetical protein
MSPLTDLAAFEEPAPRRSLRARTAKTWET